MGHFEKGRWIETPVKVTQIRTAIISNAQHICKIYGVGCNIDESYIATAKSARVLIGVELIGTPE